MTDPQEESAGVVEYKNPYNARDMTISEAVEKVKDFCLTHDEDGRLRLKESHPYYYQVQATMFCGTGVISLLIQLKTCTLKGSGLMNSFGPKLCLNSKLSILMLYFLNWLAQGMITVAYVNHQNGSKANRIRHLTHPAPTCCNQSCL